MFFAPKAGAQVVDLTFEGVFTGTSSGATSLTTALSPLLGTGSFNVGLSLDRGVTGSPFFEGGTLYRALSNVSSSFSGFTSTHEGCTSPSEFFCTVRVFNRTGLSGTGSDVFNVFSDVGRSTALETASGSTRQLTFQFMFLLNDFLGTTLSNESLALDLTTQNLDLIFSQFTVFAPTTTGVFERADFGLQLRAIRPSAVVPEPSTYALVAVGLAGVGIVGRRRRHARLAFEQAPQ